MVEDLQDALTLEVALQTRCTFSVRNTDRSCAIIGPGVCGEGRTFSS